MATLDTTGTEGTPISADALTVDVSAGDPVIIPDGLNPATADFSHEGPDLVMTWPDGSQVVVTDYFMAENQPSLTSTDGARIDGDIASRLAGSQTPGQVAQVGEGVAEQPIGQVDTLSGTVTAVRADGTKVELKPGDPVYQGDILESSADGAIGVVLADETTFSMAENGRMVLDEMVFDPGTQEGSVSLSVMQGVFTFVSGQVAKTDPDAMTLNTPVATIGIRGTQVGLDIADGKEMKVALMEEADGFVGEIVITNNAGVTVLNGANEFTSIGSFELPASSVVQMSSFDVGNMFANALKAIPVRGNVNDFGFQNDTVSDGSGDLDVNDLADFETAAGGEDSGPAEVSPLTVAVDAAADAVLDVATTGEGSSGQPVEAAGTDDASRTTTEAARVDAPAPAPAPTGPVGTVVDGVWTAQVDGTYDGSTITLDQNITGGAGTDNITTGVGNDTVQ
ncbi:MAG: FecR domain-containing protein, partial [Rhodospirillaceae bacterium]|nr:FecR domain-containing protein [Rhodospirillaceae bacterium]